jgi:hypothetical protein
MAKALQSVVVVLVGSPDATRKDVCVEKMDWCVIAIDIQTLPAWTSKKWTKLKK